MPIQDFSHISTFEELLEISEANGYDRNWASRKAKALGIVNPRGKKKNEVHKSNEIHKLNNEPSEKSYNHSKFEPLQAQVEQLKSENIRLKQELENHELMFAMIQELKNELKCNLPNRANKPTQNERGAGRKSKLNDELIAKVKSLRNEGKSHKSIAIDLGISVGLVHKASKL